MAGLDRDEILDAFAERNFRWLEEGPAPAPHPAIAGAKLRASGFRIDADPLDMYGLNYIRRH